MKLGICRELGTNPSLRDDDKGSPLGKKGKLTRAHSNEALYKSKASKVSKNHFKILTKELRGLKEVCTRILTVLRNRNRIYTYAEQRDGTKSSRIN